MCPDREKDVLNLWFNNIEGLGAARRRYLREIFGDIRNIYDATETQLRQLVQDDKTVQMLLKSQDLSVSEKYLEELTKREIKIVYPGHPYYPDRLMHIYDAPDILYVKGILRREEHIYNRSIGIVGSRNPDVYGREMASMFARKLAEKGCIVVSGMARGIDSAVHRGALEAGGYTVAVLGCGINVTYPPENAELYHEICHHGAVISEHGLNVRPAPGLFPIRNRIISGLSDGILVVEARKKSGSLITADCALEQGRQVYAVPGRAYDLNSEGTNNLIKQGALCVTDPEEILQDLNGDMRSDSDEETGRKPEEIIGISDEYRENDNDVIKNSLAPAEKMVYSCLSLEPMYIDDIIGASGIGITGAISTLYSLEEKGIIKQPIRGYYIITV